MQVVSKVLRHAMYSAYGGRLGAVAGIRRKGLSDGLTLTRWRNAIFRVAGATN